MVQEEEKDNAMGSGNVVALIESTEVFCFLYYDGQHRLQKVG